MNTSNRKMTSIANLCNIAGVLIIIGCAAIAVLGMMAESAMSIVYGLLAALVSALPWFALAATLNALVRVESRLERMANTDSSEATVSSIPKHNALDEWRAKNPGKSLNDYYMELNR